METTRGVRWAGAVLPLALSVPVDGLALWGYDALLGGFEIHGLRSFVLGVVGLGLPTTAWLLLVNTLPDPSSPGLVDSVLARLVRLRGVLAVVVPILFVAGLSLPGLLLAEWLSPDLRIDGFWTYAAAWVIASAVLACLGELRVLGSLPVLRRLTGPRS